MTCPSCELPMILYHAAASCWGVVEVWACGCGAFIKRNIKYDGTSGTTIRYVPLNMDWDN